MTGNHIVRKCKVCQASSADVRFYVGVTSRCAECHRKLVRENRHNKAEYYRKYDAMRFQKDALRKKTLREYGATPRGRLALQRARKNWLNKNPEKRAAHTKLSNAIRDGRVVKPQRCSICGCKPKRLHGHHFDYNKPFEVVWCCPDCHANLHRKHHFDEAA